MHSLSELPIALVGLRGAGKTTVGGLLAASLGRRFVDLDDEILRAAKASGIVNARSTAGELLSSCGLPEFRSLEAQALSVLLAEPTGLVLATGGGAVETEANRELLRNRSLCVWLRASPEVLAARVDADPATRPPLVPGGSLAEARELGLRRNPLYREVARLDIDSGVLTPREVAKRVATGLRRLSLTR